MSAIAAHKVTAGQSVTRGGETHVVLAAHRSFMTGRSGAKCVYLTIKATPDGWGYLLDATDMVEINCH